MIKSDKINEVALALMLIQGEIGPAIKDARNPHLKNKYATLAAIWNVALPALQKYHCSVIQPPEDVGDNKVGITTIIMHESGQYIGGTLSIPVAVQKGVNLAQVVGSGITYARRYSLASLLGIMQEDDDGHGAGPGGGQRLPTKPTNYGERITKGLIALGVPSTHQSEERVKLHNTFNGDAEKMYNECVAMYGHGVKWNEEHQELRAVQ